MKKISRLTALLLAVMMLSSAAFATESVIEFHNFDTNDYTLMVAAAQDANAAIGKTAVTNQDNVEVRNTHYLYISYVKDHLDEGTVVEITDYKTGAVNGSWFDSYWYGVSYEKDGKTETGYIQTKYLTIQEPEPEISYTPWDETQTTATLSFEVENAASYVWERGVVNADGSVTWMEEPVATGAELTLSTDVNGDFSALQYTYRCVAKSESGETIQVSDGITLVRADIAGWLSGEAVDQEMLLRALSAPSLDSLVIEGEWVMHVRTGDRFAYYNSRTNALIAEETGKVLGFVIGDVVYAPRG